MKAQKWILTRLFEGFPKDSDLELQEETLPELQDGDVLFEAVSLSVDPYMRLFGHEVNGVMNGEQVARVSESKHPDYKKSDLYLGKFGWRTHTVVNMNSKDCPEIQPLMDMGDLPVSLGLGTLGMPGVTAHEALLKVCKPKEGDVVVVNCAAGAVGHVVGQIAKIKGCTVIGSAGSDEKVAWLKELGFDHAFNYKTCNIDKAIKAAAPDGVDIFYDNVGGEFYSTVIQNHMRMNGRVVIVGVISQYNKNGEMKDTSHNLTILLKRLRVEGFIIFDTKPEDYREAQTNLKAWMVEGKLKTREHVTKGFENMRDAFYGLFRGDNTGKAVVNV